MLAYSLSMKFVYQRNYSVDGLRKTEVLFSFLLIQLFLGPFLSAGKNGPPFHSAIGTFPPRHKKTTTLIPKNMASHCPSENIIFHHLWDLNAHQPKMHFYLFLLRALQQTAFREVRWDSYTSSSTFCIVSMCQPGTSFLSVHAKKHSFLRENANFQTFPAA